jgi:hypothetical protein
MIFLFRWRHIDGSIVEFSEKGWKADDPKKSAWLIKMSELCSSSPVLAPVIRVWLQENCQLVEFSGPGDAARQFRVAHHSGTELGELEAFARAVNGGLFPNFSERTKPFSASATESAHNGRPHQLSVQPVLSFSRDAAETELQCMAKSQADRKGGPNLERIQGITVSIAILGSSAPLFPKIELAGDEWVIAPLACQGPTRSQSGYDGQKKKSSGTTIRLRRQFDLPISWNIAP